MGSPPKVLVADDDEFAGGIVVELLSRQGVAAEMSENGEDVIRRFRSGEQFDVVLLDWELGDMTGIDVLQEIRNCTDMRLQGGYRDRPRPEPGSRRGGDGRWCVRILGETSDSAAAEGNVA